LYPVREFATINCQNLFVAFVKTFNRSAFVSDRETNENKNLILP
jgi:hypothetical protein